MRQKIAPASEPTGAMKIEDVARGRSTNPRAGKTSVALDPYLAAAEKVGHCRYRLFRAFGAGADRQDKVAEREF